MADAANSKRPGRWWQGLAVILAIAAVPLLIYRAELSRLLRFADLFDPDRIVYNFQHMDEILLSRTVEAGGEVFEFARGSYSLPESFRYRDRSTWSIHTRASLPTNTAPCAFRGRNPRGRSALTCD